MKLRCSTVVQIFQLYCCIGANDYGHHLSIPSAHILLRVHVDFRLENCVRGPRRGNKIAVWYVAVDELAWTAVEVDSSVFIRNSCDLLTKLKDIVLKSGLFL